MLLRPRRMLASVAALLVATGGGAAVIACGGSEAASRPVTAGSGSPAGADGGAPSLARPSPAPAGLPPMAVMPPAGVAGSRKATRKTDPALAGCASAVPRAKDPADLVRRVGAACATAAPAARLSPLGPALRGEQADKDPHAEHVLRVEAGKCYRVYFAINEGAREVVVVARDSAGDVVAESPGPALPADGTMCFTSADELTLLVGVGSGKASYVAQPWAD